MSFKREGDDKSQLNILQKRRVADLLSNFIPDDEAALMRNGRYSCVVCSHRPVFDTVDTLTVHRNGKRHLEGLKAFYGKKARLKNERLKRHHENYVQAEDTRQEPSCSAPLLEQTRRLTHHALLKTAPYNSCHTKTSTKSEKGPPSTGSEFSLSACKQTTSQQQKEKKKSEDSQSSAAGEGAPPSDLEGPKGAMPLEKEKQEEPLPEQRRRELQHYLKLKSDGWLKDRSGQWVRDENVEFDSDEEEPTSPGPLPTSP
uniref:Sodium channel modifier 1 n=1 Tax=Gasterosteus aculeatus aculeatus TaxID=481459 RepID=G3PJZ0_GASAC|nr:sodium channel modifier 1 isoform X1 [Gasterosteus aculeatus aculeatus]